MDWHAEIAISKLSFKRVDVLLIYSFDSGKEYVIQKCIVLAKGRSVGSA
jgi:hypothetical protein